jgi:hypothetical protein
MELSTTREATSCEATRYPSILWNRKVHYRIHKSSTAIATLSQTNPVHTTPVLTLSTYLRLGLASGLFPSGFPTNNIYAFHVTVFTCILVTRLQYILILDIYFRPTPLQASIKVTTCNRASFQITFSPGQTIYTPVCPGISRLWSYKYTQKLDNW